MLVGLAGNKGVGKDTVAEHLVEQGFTRIGFADKMKEAIANLFDITIEQVDGWKNREHYIPVLVQIQFADGTIQTRMEWREFLQRFGTEMGRKTFGEDFWVSRWMQYLDPDDIYKDIVVPDVRFPNEAKWIKKLGGHMVGIYRPGYEPDGHVSEERLSERLIDATIVNNGTIEEMNTLADAIVANWRGRHETSDG
jgi:hypothetical protein